MTKKAVEIKLQSGLEARPVAMLVQVASRYDSSVYLECEGKKVNAKSIMGMMSLGLVTGESVTVIADGAFTGTNAQRIDLGYNVRYVWGNAFGGYPLSDLYLHTDVMIEETAFSGCTQDFTIHCPDYLENTSGELWCNLATSYGFRWQQEIM
jgi:catabolite repression HPr-like protein